MDTHKLNRGELITLVQRIIDATGSEEEMDQAVDLLRRNVIDPNVTDYIYWPKEGLTAEKIVDKAVQYKPICL